MDRPVVQGLRDPAPLHLDRAGSFRSDGGLQGGEAPIDGEPVLVVLPLGRGLSAQPVLLELAATLFDREQISLSLAARLAGLAYSEMIDELGRRQISVIRLAAGDLERELAAFGT